MEPVITGHKISVYQALFPFDLGAVLPIMAPLDGQIASSKPLWRNW